MSLSEDVEMRSAERRALVILGITAVLAAILSAMLSAVWTGKGNWTDFNFNFPPVNSPIPHVTYYWIPILEAFVIIWMIYAFFEFWYFSADWLPLEFRKLLHNAATLTMGIYVLLIVPIVPLTYIGLVWITQPLQQSVYFVFAISFIAILEIDFVWFAIREGQKRFIPRIVRWILKHFKRQRPFIGATQLGV